VEDELAPFSSELSETLADVCVLLSFITYEHGLDILGALKLDYEKEESRRRTEEIRIKAEQIEALRRRIRNSGESPEEYMLALEKQLKLMQTELAAVEPIKLEIKKLEDERDGLILKNSQLHGDVTLLTAELGEINGRWELELEGIKAEHNERILEMSAAHSAAISELENKHSAELVARFEQHRAEISELENIYSARKKEADAEIEALRASLEAKCAELAELKTAHDELKSENELAQARLKGIRAEHGLMTDEDSFTDKERFDRLEKEYDAFTRFYKSQWNKTKKQIRKKVLDPKSLKGNGGQD
jgi:chromosome segregation ATPase